MRTIWTLALVLALLPLAGLARPTPVHADEMLEKPSVAWSGINAEARKERAYAKRRELIKTAAASYLEQFQAKGGMALGQEALSLGFIQRAAEQWQPAMLSFRSVWANAANSEGMRDQGAMHEARLLANADLRKTLGAKPCAAAIAALRHYAGAIEDEKRGSMRSSIESNLAGAIQATGDKQGAYDLRLAIAKRDPAMVARLYRSLVHGLLGKTHAMEGYDKARTDAKDLLALLSTQQAKAVELAEAKRKTAFAALTENSPASLDEQGKLKAKPRNQQSALERVAAGAERNLSNAKRYLTRLETAGKPFSMLGKPAPDWTLEHAFGELKSLGDLKGKVVVLDFWATWCPWCIRSFPAIRDLMKDYADKGLVVVGVTASAGTVYAARYDLDDDLKDKHEPGERARAAARLARGNQKPDGKTLFSAEDFPAKEREVITPFIAHHQMTWPVVMIDKAEPGPKYALGGWPHAVVIDRQGRVRYFKSGALLRDRVDAVKAFRAMLEDLLAEKAE